MGSMIYLAVGRLEVDWGKNHGFTDHSPLFQVTDVHPVPYYYVNEDDTGWKDEDGEYHYNLITEMKDGLSKPLLEVIERIDLLGHSLASAEKEFELHALSNSVNTSPFGFDELAKALAEVDVLGMSADYSPSREDFGKFYRRHLHARIGLDKLDISVDARFNMGYIAENLSAYTVLRLLSFNPQAAQLRVDWAFEDLEYGGWARREEFVKQLNQENRFLIVTEGSTDAGIIKHAFKLLKPHLADFFDFVDMNEGYPFTGTGNLFNFTKGLISIAVQNKVIILYDNDAEGVAGYNRTQRLNLPANMKVLKLPDLEVFADFMTIGPSGHHAANINGQAAAIECYLDTAPNAVVRWTSYNQNLDAYQGEISDKAKHMQRFFAVKDSSESYDFSKITAVINMIISECITMRETKHLAALDHDIENWSGLDDIIASEIDALGPEIQG